MRGTSSLCRATRGADSLPWVLLMPDKPCLARGLCRAAALPGSAGCPPGRVSAASRSAAFLFSQGPGFANKGSCVWSVHRNAAAEPGGGLG